MDGNCLWYYTLSYVFVEESKICTYMHVGRRIEDDRVYV